MAKLAKNRKVKETGNNLADHIEAQSTVVDEAGIVSSDKVQWDVQQGEVQSSTNLEDDLGTGKQVIVRSFDFKANPEAFAHATPSKQELFDAHAHQIEVILWKDGLQVMPDVKPQLIFSKKRDGYRIVVGAEPAKGFLMPYSVEAQTLSQIANGNNSKLNPN